jgi:hypothetical protein
MKITKESFKKIEEKLKKRNWCLFAIKTNFNNYLDQPVLCVLNVDLEYNITMFYYELSLKKFTWRKIGKMYMKEDGIEKLFSIKIQEATLQKKKSLQDIQKIVNSVLNRHNDYKRKKQGGVNVCNCKPFLYKYAFIVDLVSYEITQSLSLPDNRVNYSCRVYKNGTRTGLITLYTIKNKKTNLIVSEKPLILTAKSLKDIIKKTENQDYTSTLFSAYTKEKKALNIVSMYKWLTPDKTIVNAKSVLEIDIETKKVAIIEDVFTNSKTGLWEKTQSLWDDSSIQAIFGITLISREI